MAVECKMPEVLLEANRRGLISARPRPQALKQLLEDLAVPRNTWHIWGC